MTTTIRISRETKNQLQTLGAKGQSYEEIIIMIYHQRNILMIHEICKNMNYPPTTSMILQVFDEIGYHIPNAPETPNLKGETWYTNNDWNTAQRMYMNHVFEIAKDEDLVGNRKPSVAEYITNIYCLFEDIPAPTWNLARRNPFAKF